MFSAPVWPQISFKLTAGATSADVAFWVAAADFNGDGSADVASANANVTNQSSGSISANLAKGGGTFQAPVTYSAMADATPFTLRPADFNNDGKIDLFVSCGLSSGVFVPPGVGDGTFGEPIVTQTPVAPFVGSEFPLNEGLTNPAAPLVLLNRCPGVIG